MIEAAEPDQKDSADGQTMMEVLDQPVEESKLKDQRKAFVGDQYLHQDQQSAVAEAMVWVAEVAEVIEAD